MQHPSNNAFQFEKKVNLKQIQKLSAISVQSLGAVLVQLRFFSKFGIVSVATLNNEKLEKFN